MPRLDKLCRLYLLLVLTAAVILSPAPYSLLAITLLPVWLFNTIRPLKPKLGLVLSTFTVFLLPQTIEPVLSYALPGLIAPVIATLLSLPVIFLLDSYLRQNAQSAAIASNSNGRYITVLAKSHFASASLVLLMSVILGNRTALFSGSAFGLYSLATLARALLNVPAQPLAIPLQVKRTIAGTTVDVSLDTENRASVPLHGRLKTVEPWAKVTPERFNLNGNKIRLNLALTPPLAGPSRPGLQLSVLDPWGYVQTSQTIEPVELQVIPRARYAEWLAMKYLEYTGSGASGTSATLPPRLMLIPKRGTEYFDSRNYQPGDSLRRVDWKHSLKQNQLIIKEFIEGGEQTAIIAVNLSVRDAEEADKLAFNLITTALTLSYEAIPSALAAYNQKKVILTTAVSAPRETLKKTLSLVKEIGIEEFAQKLLLPADPGRLKRNIVLLKEAISEPARNLASLLGFELRAIEAAAQNNPATHALATVVQRTPPPAVIIPLTNLNHDAEALGIILEKLGKRGFNALMLDNR